MKKHILIVLSVAVALLVSCTQKSVLQTATGASGNELQVLEECLSTHNINYASVGTSENPIIDGMRDDWEAYDLLDENGTTYLLILSKPDKSFEALFDDQNELVEGLIDKASIPSAFKD